MINNDGKYTASLSFKTDASFEKNIQTLKNWFDANVNRNITLNLKPETVEFVSQEMPRDNPHIYEYWSYNLKDKCFDVEQCDTSINRTSKFQVRIPRSNQKNNNEIEQKELNNRVNITPNKVTEDPFSDEYRFKLYTKILGYLINNKPNQTLALLEDFLNNDEIKNLHCSFGISLGDY